MVSLDLDHGATLLYMTAGEIHAGHVALRVDAGRVYFADPDGYLIEIISS
ncbi:hypothetical protein [Pseudonocardia lacus]|nr:hypothetical protein [Pseudonocardia lacus]